METDGNHNLPETLNLKLEVDSLLIDIFLFFSQQIFFTLNFSVSNDKKYENYLPISIFYNLTFYIFNL